MKRPKIDVIYHEEEGKDIYDRVVEIIRAIHEERDPLYGDNWALYSLETLLYAAAYKIERARFTWNINKKLDDVFDAINYLIFAANKLLDEVETQVDEGPKG